MYCTELSVHYSVAEWKLSKTKISRSNPWQTTKIKTLERDALLSRVESMQNKNLIFENANADAKIKRLTRQSSIESARANEHRRETGARIQILVATDSRLDNVAERTRRSK